MADPNASTPQQTDPQELAIRANFYVAAAVMALATSTRMGAIPGGHPADPGLSGTDDVPLTTEMVNLTKTYYWWLVALAGAPDQPNLSGLIQKVKPPGRGPGAGGGPSANPNIAAGVGQLAGAALAATGHPLAGSVTPAIASVLGTLIPFTGG